MTESSLIPGYELLGLLGTGSCGTVYRARDLAQPAIERAVKVFDPLAISRNVLDSKLHRLQAYHQPTPMPGLVQTHDWRMKAPPYYVVMDLMAATTRTGECRPYNTLEYWIGRIHGPEAWTLISEIASTLAQLHLNGFSHGNLRPRNVFLTTDPAARAKLTDMGQGWVDGVHHIELTDHLFHLAPEQIHHPERNQMVDAARWDVYAFGVLAYRLLNHQWPRGQKIIADQLAHMEATGGKKKPWVESNIIAEIEGQVAVDFPKPAQDYDEERRRDLILRCLSLPAKERPRDMREVWEEIQRGELISSREKTKTSSDNHQRAMTLSLSASRKRNKILVYSLIGLGGFATLTQIRQCASARANSRQELELAAIKQENNKARTDAETHRQAAQKARESLAQERKELSPAVHALFHSLAENYGAASIATLPEPVLRQMLGFYQKRVEALATKDEGLTDKSQIYLNLARLQDQLQMPAEASSSYATATALLRKLQAVERGPAEIRATTERLADALSRMAQLNIAQGKADEARPQLANSALLYQQLMQSTAFPGEKLREKSAAIFLAEARSFQEKGRLNEAGANLDTAIGFLRGDSVGNLEVPVLRRMLAGAQHDRGVILRQLGKPAPVALDAQTAALDLLISLRAKSEMAPENDRLTLAAVYVETGELHGESNNSAKSMEAHINAINLLQAYLQKQPNEDEARSNLARSYREVARLEREAGKKEPSLKRARAAVDLSREVVKRQPQSRRFALVLAACLAILADSLASEGQLNEADAVAIEAGDIARKAPVLPAGESTNFQQAEQQISLAQVFTTRGKIHKLAAREDESRVAFASAIVSWQKVLDLIPDHALATARIPQIQQLSAEVAVPKAVAPPPVAETKEQKEAVPPARPPRRVRRSN